MVEGFHSTLFESAGPIENDEWYRSLDMLANSGPAIQASFNTLQGVGSGMVLKANRQHRIHVLLRKRT
ncbi:MAG TPA: hypothetical protein VGR71_02035 [Nitrospira sp.]|nr:hypothetical protein [Nitrospira sp.]